MPFSFWEAVWLSQVCAELLTPMSKQAIGTYVIQVFKEVV
jgi:hypothetical protein